MTRLLRAIGITGFLVATPAMAYEHKDEVATYAITVAVAQVASDRCPDIVVFAEGLSNLASNSHLVPADQMGVQLEIRSNVAMFRAQVDKSPFEWCNDVLGDFGPNGKMMSGILKRQ